MIQSRLSKSADRFLAIFPSVEIALWTTLESDELSRYLSGVRQFASTIAFVCSEEPVEMNHKIVTDLTSQLGLKYQRLKIK